MKTSKPFSTISYNSTAFLLEALTRLVNRRKIDFFAFVEHLPEDDETKAHKHVFVIPNGQVQTDELKDLLTEYDPENPTKPLGCIAIQSSKWADWYLYSRHDGKYLGSKGQARRYVYQNEDFAVSDEDYFRELIHTIDYSKLNRVSVLTEAVEDGIPFQSLVATGQIPVQQISAYYTAYGMIADFTFRNGRSGHEQNEEQDATTSAHHGGESGN